MPLIYFTIFNYSEDGMTDHTVPMMRLKEMLKHEYGQLAELRDILRGSAISARRHECR